MLPCSTKVHRLTPTTPLAPPHPAAAVACCSLARCSDGAAQPSTRRAGGEQAAAAAGGHGVPGGAATHQHTNACMLAQACGRGAAGLAHTLMMVVRMHGSLWAGRWRQECAMTNEARPLARLACQQSGRSGTHPARPQPSATATAVAAPMQPCAISRPGRCKVAPPRCLAQPSCLGPHGTARPAGEGDGDAAPGGDALGATMRASEPAAQRAAQVSGAGGRGAAWLHVAPGVVGNSTGVVGFEFSNVRPGQLPPCAQEVEVSVSAVQVPPSHLPSCVTASHLPSSRSTAVCQSLAQRAIAASQPQPGTATAAWHSHSLARAGAWVRMAMPCLLHHSAAACTHADVLGHACAWPHDGSGVVSKGRRRGGCNAGFLPPHPPSLCS